VSRRASRVITLLGWLLTPFVVWAASFSGGWLGAVVGRRVGGPFGGIEWLVLGAALGGIAALIGWSRRLRRRAGPAEPAGDAAADGEVKGR
jgi:uncharacterized membrane protein